MLSGGAANMLGMSPTKDNGNYPLPLDDSPSTRQGFGRLSLLQSLPLSSSSGILNFNMQVRHSCGGFG